MLLLLLLVFCAVAEWTPEERAQGMHSASLRFAYESRSQRGWAKQAELNASEKNVAKPVEDSVRSITA